MSGTQTSRPRGGVVPAVWESVRQPGFVTCVVLLVLLTGTFYGTLWNRHLQKLPAPLRAPLSGLDRTVLDPPYRLLDAAQIPPEVIDQLGTDQYIQWLLENTKENDSSPVKLANLFITYYTGTPDPVPHIPENCYLGAGYDMGGTEDWNIDIPKLDRQVPVRVLELEKKGRFGTERSVVAYTFGVNGRFAVDRNEVRAIVGNPWEAYAFFSKVEVKFQGRAGVTPTRQEAMTAAADLFRKLLPLLVENHWPDWKALHEKSEPTSTTRQVK
jgi:hypothetical protein